MSMLKCGKSFGVLPLLLYLFLPLAKASSMSSSEEARCSTKDFTEQMGPVRDQGDTNFCGSYTAADLVGQRLGYGSRISALQTAYSGYTSIAEGTKYKLMESASAKAAMKDATAPSVIEAEFGSASNYARKQMEHANFKFYEGLMPGMAVYSFNFNAAFCLDLYNGGDEKKMANQIQRLENNVLQRLRPRQGSTPESKDRLLLALDKTGHPELFSRLVKMEMDYECQKNGKMISLTQLLEPKITNCANEKRLCLNQVNEALEKGRIVGISYFVGRLQLNRRDTDNYHASTVIARKWDPTRKKCQYKIRNSAGPECTRYRTEPGITCFRGNIWVDESILLEMMNQTTYIK